MVVYSQPVCPPQPPPLSPFKFARFGMFASTALLSLYSSMKKLCVSIICVVTYHWEGEKERDAGGSGSIQLSWWWM